MKRVLIIRQGAIGDVVHTSNIFRSIKEKHPDVVVDYLSYLSLKTPKEKTNNENNNDDIVRC